ncbi:MAG: ATP-dependent RecD-like DNA helicase [Parachlamydiales bacterium]|nr:ATP-dependent RecD-like DNA helicase [Parachlamydiales bacterium]
MDTYQGYIEHISFANQENGFTIAKFKSDTKKDLITIIGVMPSVRPGETLEIQGNWKIHQKFGSQFEIESYKVKFPSDLVGIQKYLESGLIKGIGPVYAEKIVKKFGIKTLDIIDNTPYRLNEINGIGPKRIDMIIKNWQDQKVIREVIIFLKSYDITPTFAQKIYKLYGEASIRKVKENPYILAKDIHGIGFKKADLVAEKLGFEKTSHLRILSGIEYVLMELTNQGHTCYPKEKFLPIAERILEVDSSLIENEIKTLILKNELIKDDLEIDGEKTSFLWLKTFYNFEKNIAEELNRIKNSDSSIRKIDIDKAIIWAQKELKIELAEKQIEAIKQALANKVQIITGGPGTGKSTITKVILTILKQVTKKIILCAPTGRAAKRLSQITNFYASTIHSLLEMDFTSSGFKKNENNPIKSSLIIIDEASMIDTFLMNHLLKAISSSTKVIFIGDIDQLPSVGAGYVLNDLIKSEKIPAVYLKEIFRQAKHSKIISNAHKINESKFPDINNDEKSDFRFFALDDTEEIEKMIVNLVEKELPNKKNLDPFKDIQVLSPMRKGKIGIENLNIVLQSVLNPSSKPLFRAGQRFHVKDKVMQIKNNYQKNVFNGDIGIILNIDNVEHIVTIQFDDKKVSYDFSELDEVNLAYAVSVHKYQGSECPCIIVPVHTSHFKLLYKNLLYTAITRGKKLVILLGTTKAIAIAVKNKEVLKRYTGLKNAITKIDKPSQKTYLFDI